MFTKTDIDIDFADRNSVVSLFKHVPSLQRDLTKHNTGLYFQNIPQDPTTGATTLDAERAAELGYFKLDFLNNTIYKEVRDETHLIALAEREPDWELFESPGIVEKLTHIHKYFYVVDSIKPTCVEDLAVIIALIRPGKKHLRGKPRAEIDAEIWAPVEDDQYAFKKSHSFAFALSIVVQLNLLLEQAYPEQP